MPVLAGPPTSKDDGVSLAFSFYDMAIIYATKGQAIQVDDEWHEELSKFKWHVSKNGYAARAIHIPGQRAPKVVYMHRVILGLSPGDGIITDHINEDKLDNRKANLRGSTKAENGRNRGKNSRNTTGYKGVCVRKRAGGRVKYSARIVVNWKVIHLGVFDTAEEAHKSYCEGAKKYHGEFANFGD